MSLKAIMLVERGEYNASRGFSGNGFRSRKTLGRGKLLELCVPPEAAVVPFCPVLLALLRDQEEYRSVARPTKDASFWVRFCLSRPCRGPTKRDKKKRKTQMTDI